MKLFIKTAAVLCLLLISIGCSESGQFVDMYTEIFGKTMITENDQQTIVLANPSDDSEQHIRAIAFDRGSNSAGHFTMDKLIVGNKEVKPSDIVIPPSESLKIYVTYSPKNLEISTANYGDWKTGESSRWIPRSEEEIAAEKKGAIIQRAIIEAVYDHPKDGIIYVQLVGEALPGPEGEQQLQGGFAQCNPGGGTACYTGGFALDVPALAPGGPKPLEITGPIKIDISGGQAKMKMSDFPYVIYVLKSEDIPQLPSGVTATLVISGVSDAEATGQFDGSKLELNGVAFKIRVALGELTSEELKQGMSALVDFDITDLTIDTIKPFDQGKITLHMETSLPPNPSGNELFDQFLSGASIVAVMEGELRF